MHWFKFDRVIVITLSAALLSIIIGLAVLANVKKQLVRVSTEQYKSQQSQLANQIADTLSTNFINIQNQLQIMASMPEVQNIDDQATCNAKLTELLSITQRQLGNLARTDENGFFACSVNLNLIGQDSRRYGTYINDLIADPNHSPALSRLARPSGADTLAAGLHIPVYHNGRFRGSLGGAFYFNQFQDAYLRSIKVGSNGFAILLDDNGDILFHHDPTLNGKSLLDPKVLRLFEPQDTIRHVIVNIKTGQSGSFEYSITGTKKIGMYKTFKVPNVKRNWAVVITIPTEDLDTAIEQAGINRIFTILVALLSVTTALLTFVSLRNILRDRELQRIKNDFISITSHQLRTPATIVKQNLGIIKDGYITSKEDCQKFIEAAYESNENQLNIIENILSASKLEAGRLELHKETVDLQALTAKLADDLRLSAKARRHKLRIKLAGRGGGTSARRKPVQPVALQADPTKLSMAIENLLSNAIKYTPDGGTITVTVSHSDSHADIAVTDTGQGVSQREMAQLFQRFNRLHGDETSHVPGTGLGLYLSKKIVELHNGTIRVESRVGKGTTFTIRLPLR